MRGAVFDVAVDIRTGSPTFGRWDAVRLDDRTRKTNCLSEVLAHGFLALANDSTVVYLCSAPYNPTRECTILATDSALGIAGPVPSVCRCTSVTSSLPRLADLEGRGILPTWRDSCDFVEELRTRVR